MSVQILINPEHAILNQAQQKWRAGFKPLGRGQRRQPLFQG